MTLTKELQISNKRWIRRVKHSGIFLTFDDGPNPAITPRLLDLLLEVGASATFFVTGEALDDLQAPALLRRMLAEGHTIGNHGELHFKDGYPEFEITQRRIEEACGLRTTIFRAPHGSKVNVAEYLQRDRNALGVHWTCHLEDWLPVDPAKIGRRIPEIVTPGSIVLLHDGAPSSDSYRDRGQVLVITRLIADECRRKSMAMVGLASVYPDFHRARGQSKGLQKSSMTNSIAATFGMFKQWYSSH